MPQLHLASESSHGYRWLTADEAAHYLKVKARTLLRWVRQGKIKGYALSGSTRHYAALRHRTTMNIYGDVVTDEMEGFKD